MRPGHTRGRPRALPRPPTGEGHRGRQPRHVARQSTEPGRGVDVNREGGPRRRASASGYASRSGRRVSPPVRRSCRWRSAMGIHARPASALRQSRRREHARPPRPWSTRRSSDGMGSPVRPSTRGVSVHLGIWTTGHVGRAPNLSGPRGDDVLAVVYLMPYRGGKAGAGTRTRRARAFVARLGRHRAASDARGLGRRGRAVLPGIGVRCVGGRVGGLPGRDAELQRYAQRRGHYSDVGICGVLV